jgi:hypothetical protein
VQGPRWGEGIGVVHENVICRRVIGATCTKESGFLVTTTIYFNRVEPTVPPLAATHRE